MKIYYVGTKPDGETAFSPITGITWMPGDSHDIADEKIAIRMLQHPDVFSKAPPRADRGAGCGQHSARRWRVEQRAERAGRSTDVGPCARSKPSAYARARACLGGRQPGQPVA